eukprot:48908_1
MTQTRRHKRYKDPMDETYRPPRSIKIPPKPKQNSAPKRPMSAYFLYAADKRPQVKRTNPDLSLTEMAKLIGSDWSKCTKREKKKYEESAAKALADYKEKRAEYEAGSAYKNWKKKSKEWKELWQEEYDQQQLDKEENKNKQKKTKKNDKKTNDKKKAGGKARGRRKS